YFLMPACISPCWQRVALPVVTSVSAKPDDNFVQVNLRARAALGLDPFHMELLLFALKKV
ncbi:hypothetical protein, partial [Pseudomonas sp. P5_A2_2]